MVTKKLFLYQNGCRPITIEGEKQNGGRTITIKDGGEMGMVFEVDVRGFF
jgi:hypothetical protein